MKFLKKTIFSLQSWKILCSFRPVAIMSIMVLIFPMCVKAQQITEEIRLLDSIFKIDPNSAITQAEQLYYKKEKAGDELAQLKVLYVYSRYNGMMGRYEISLPRSLKGIELAGRLQDESAQGDFCNILGNSYLAQNRVDSAAHFFLKGAEILEKLGEKMKSGYLFNNLSNIYNDDQKHELALEYLRKSMSLLDEAGGEELPFYGTITGNMSRAYLGLDSFILAAEYAKKTFDLGENNNNSTIQVYGLLALGDIALKMGEHIQAEQYYLQAYKISEVTDDDYRRAQSALSLAKTLKESNADRALNFALEADQYYKANLPRFRNEIVQLIGDLYELKGNIRMALDYYRLYANLQDSTLKLEYDKTKLDLIEKYETSQKNLVIQTQEKELSEKRLRILRLTGGLLLALLLIVILISYYWAQKKLKTAQINKIILEQEQKMMMAMIEGEQKERTRLAKEIHDGIANDVAALKMQTEIKNLQLNSPTLDEIGIKLSEIHQNTRNAAHALFPKALISSDLPQSIRELCAEYQSIIPVHFENTSYQAGKTKALELFLYRLVQEALGNAMRHAEAKEINIRLQDDGSNIEIEIKDDGKGMDDMDMEKGLGYLQSRVHELGGRLMVNTNRSTGTNLKIIFKYAN